MNFINKTLCQFYIIDIRTSTMHYLREVISVSLQKTPGSLIMTVTTKEKIASKTVGKHYFTRGVTCLLANQILLTNAKLGWR